MAQMSVRIDDNLKSKLVQTRTDNRQILLKMH